MEEYLQSMNFGIGYNALTEGTKPFPEQWLHIIKVAQWLSPEAISQKIPQIFDAKMCLKKTYLKLQPHLPGANEKTNWVYQGLVKIVI